MTPEAGLSSNGQAFGFPAACQSLLELCPVPMAELEGDLHRVRYANPALCRLLDKSRESLAGMPFADAIRVDDSCLAVLDRVYQTGEAATHTECKQPADAAIRSYAMWPVLDPDQRPVGVMVQMIVPQLLDARAGAINEALLISSVYQHEQTETAQKLNDLLHTELTERKLAEEELRLVHMQLQRAFDFDQAVMASMSEGLYTIDREGQLTSMNPAAQTLFGWRFDELSGQNAHGRMHHHHPDHSAFAAAECPLLRVIETGEPVIAQEDEFIRRDGSFFPVVYSAAPVRGDADAVGVVVVFRDVTERRAAQERERALAKEIAHRNRNLLGIIQTIVSRTLAEKQSPAEAREAIMQRLQAIAKSQTALESGGFSGASLKEITRLEFAAVAGRIEAVGPEVLLNPRAAQTFSMLLHELGTNSMKYGALSSPAGKVKVEWSVEPANSGGQFRLQWVERGGPPVTPPAHEGFGSVLIDRIVAQDFGARPRVDFAPEGLRYEIEVPVSALAPEAIGTTV